MDLLRHIDGIYEAAAAPERWQPLLDALASDIGAWGAILIAARGVAFTTRAASNDNILRLSLDYPLRYPENKRAARLIASDHAGFVTENDLLAPGETYLDSSYEDYLIPMGIGRGVATTIPAPSGDTMIIHAEYPYAKEPVDPAIVKGLDALRPHFARAALLSSRLGMEQARGMARALEIIGLPGAVLESGGRLLAANTLFQALIPTVIQDRREGVSLTSSGADALLRSALGRHAATGHLATTASIPIPAADDRSAMIVHLVPIRGLAHDIFTQAEMLLVITPVDRAVVPKAEVIQGLFDLTPAEARVARSIGETRSVEDIAAAQGISRETVRAQLKAVLAKTGVSRQQELVSLLAGRHLPLS
ncbi:helix-turn-helix transcriptional regulator [Rhodopseudomonas parapalustris]